MQSANFQYFAAEQSNANFVLGIVTCVCLTVIIAIVSTGCQKSNGNIRVKGHVTYKDAPLNSGTLTFFPTNGRTTAAAISGGAYAAELMPGDYTTTVSVSPELPPGFKETDTPPPVKIVLLETFTSRAKSTLKATVRENQAEPIDFDLK
jgi:hypothetical protein